MDQTKPKPGKAIQLSRMLSHAQRLSDTFPIASSPLVGDLSMALGSSPRPTKSSRTSRGNSSIAFCAKASKQPSVGTLTITINYTCPHCLELHSQNFQLSSTMKHKITTLSSMRCSVDSRRIVVSSQLVTLGKVSMLFVEPYRTEWHK